MGQNHKNQGHEKSVTQDQGAVEVLYQKMGDRWFAFSLVGDDVFVGSISQDEIDGNGKPVAASAKSGRTYKVIGNS
jgi:hypothetical protein